MKRNSWLVALFVLATLAVPAFASNFDNTKLSAEQGAPMPQFMLARMYETGDGTDKNLAEAVKWYEKAAAQGNTMAQNRLGEMYRDGFGVAKDTQKAADLFAQALKRGLPAARVNLEALNAGVTQPQAQTAPPAAQQTPAVTQSVRVSSVTPQAQTPPPAASSPQVTQTPTPTPQTEAERLYSQGNKFMEAEKYSLALDCYSKAAEMGYGRAQYQLGLMYDTGWGVKENKKQANHWYSLAFSSYNKLANAGDADAQYQLGFMYYTGRGVKENEKQANHWYSLAFPSYSKLANAGDADAQYTLSIMYENGLGVKKNNEQAVYWIHKSADAGYIPAQTMLGINYEYGSWGLPEDLPKAIEYYRAAARQGDKFALDHLAELKVPLNPTPPTQQTAAQPSPASPPAPQPQPQPQPQQQSGSDVFWSGPEEIYQ
ncbi:hypothetical protein AGMMS50276_29140 [Synergistales bacterium]|nr:hypothetical protein AGMMS50276_29140 [Synergistales bacterium]